MQFALINSRLDCFSYSRKKQEILYKARYKNARKVKGQPYLCQACSRPHKNLVVFQQHSPSPSGAHFPEAHIFPWPHPDRSEVAES